MAKLSARDYKSSQHRPFELRRFREFGYGLLGGALLTAMAFTWLGARHKSVDAPDAPRPDPHRTATRADAEAAGGSGKPAEKYDFYQMLPNFEVVVPEKDKDVKRDLPAADSASARVPVRCGSGRGASGASADLWLRPSQVNAMAVSSAPARSPYPNSRNLRSSKGRCWEDL